MLSNQDTCYSFEEARISNMETIEGGSYDVSYLKNDVKRTNYFCPTQTGKKLKQIYHSEILTLVYTIWF